VTLSVCGGELDADYIATVSESCDAKFGLEFRRDAALNYVAQMDSTGYSLQAFLLNLAHLG